MINIHIKNLKGKYIKYMRDKKFVVAFFISLIMFIIALFVNFYAGIYATSRASNSVTDIILSNIRNFDVDGLFVYGALVLVALIGMLCLWMPNKIPFILKSISLFVIVRSLFIMLTHIGPFPTQIPIANDIISKFSFAGDLFFSGHTGLPYLMALIFWDEKYLRYLFLLISISFGIIVLLGHLHYSIDVLGAFFITYTIYHMSELFFKKDRILFNEHVVTEIL